MTQGDWQLKGDAPELYQRYLVPAITSKWAADLVSRAQPRSGENVLDVACGTGVVARLAAKKMGQGRVIGLDLNSGMLRIARVVPSEGAEITWIEGSALDLPFPANSFDLVLCQLGLQFFPDQDMALREMLRVLSPAGRIALNVYSRIENTPGTHAFAQALDRVFGVQVSQIKRGEHLFNDPEQLKNLLRNAGFANIDLHTVVQQIVFPSVRDYVRVQLLATPLAATLKHCGDVPAAVSEIAAEIERHSSASMLHDGAFSFPQEAFVAIARK